MAVQINTLVPTPGFPQTVVPGETITVPPGTIVQFVDTDTGQVLSPQNLGPEVQPDGSIQFTLPDGTTFVVVGASPEALVEPAAPPPADAAGGGSSLPALRAPAAWSMRANTFMPLSRRTASSLSAVVATSWLLGTLRNPLWAAALVASANMKRAAMKRIFFILLV